MAEIRDEKGQAGEVADATARCCGGNPAAVPQALNSLRGAAIALCMSVDELRDLLSGRNVTDNYSKEVAHENAHKLAQLRLSVAATKSENEQLRIENGLLKEKLNAYKNAFVIRL